MSSYKEIISLSLHVEVDKIYLSLSLAMYDSPS